MNQKLLMHLPNMESEEIMFVTEATKDYDDKQLDTFAIMYKGKRKDPQTILIVTLIAFLGVAGIQRFMLNQIGMGILYLLTLGLCQIGTIIDLINHKSMSLEYNKQMIVETSSLMNAMKN